MGEETGIEKPLMYFNWSSGKDSALALYYLQKQAEFNVNLLHTTLSKDHHRVSMHGLHQSLLEEQAKAIGIPLEVSYVPTSASMEIYNQLMLDKCNELCQRGYYHSAFGDIFLEDLREYREQQLDKVGIKAHFPLWKRGTKELISEFIKAGFKSVIVAANAKWFDDSFVGSVLDEDFIEKLPSEVDPCGENGEFHTFCFDGPIFEKKVPYELGEKVVKSYPDPEDSTKEVKFWFCDLMLKKATN